MFEASTGSMPEEFTPGKQCLIVLMGQRFLSTVLQVREDAMRLSFPVSDFPIDGMHVDIEFHTEKGYIKYESEVIQGPREPGDGLLVKLPGAMQWNQHRGHWRAPADFHIELRDHVHPRRHSVPAINISAGGLLFRGEMKLDSGDLVDIWLTLPGQEREQLTGRVAHVEPVESRLGPGWLYGIAFVALDPVIRRRISDYVWARVRALHPSAYRGYLRRAADDMTRH